MAASWMAVVALVGCSVDRPSSEDDVPPETAAGTPELDTSAGADEGPPDSLFVRAGACPFECCTYGTWVARAEMPVSTVELGTEIAFVLEPGDTITAETGNVHITGIQQVVVAREVPEYVGSDHVFLPGDTLLVLDYVGEGYFHAWHDGRIYQPEVFWVDEAAFTPDGGAPAYSIGTHDTEWWVRVRSASKGDGWMQMGDDVPFGGADACGLQ